MGWDKFKPKLIPGLKRNYQSCYIFPKLILLGIRDGKFSKISPLISSQGELPNHNKRVCIFPLFILSLIVI